MNPEILLSEGIEALGLALAPETQAQLMEYLQLVNKWNQTYNLTAVREIEKMVTHHLLDCLAVIPFLNAMRVLDVGSGAGLPGIPIAISRPDWNVTLLESNHKKSTFLEQARIELHLTNVKVVTERVERWQPAEKFDLVISRAFSELGEFIQLAAHLRAPGGKLVAMKGIFPYEELTQVPQELKVERVIPLAVPGLDAERHLVVIGEA